MALSPLSLANLTYVYTDEAGIDALASSVGRINMVDDDDTGTVTSPEQNYIDFAINWATSRVNFYCLQRYADACLATNWMVYYWATVLACYWLSMHRGNPPKGSFDDLQNEVIEDMKLVHDGKYAVPGLGEREVGWPAWSNVRVDVLYPLRRIRVERPLSERTATTYNQVKDWPAEIIPFDL